MRNCRSDWYIMNAKCLFDNKAANLEQVKGHWNDSTVMVVERVDDWKDKVSKPFFVVGCAGTYGKIGESKTWTQDTGMGYRAKSTKLRIVNIIKVDKAGKHIAENEIGLSKKHKVWVFK